VQFISFGKTSQALNFQIGDIIGILNPKPMKKSENIKKVSYSVENSDSVFKIGFSRDLSYCLGGSSNLGFENCSCFLNKSCEKYCVRHRGQIQEKSLAKIRQSRPQLSKGDINVLKTRVDYNMALDFQFQQRRKQADGTIKEVNNKSVEALDPEQRAKIQKIKQE